MSAIAKKLEIVANVSIIVLTILVGGTFAERAFFPSSPHQVQAGSKISLSDVDWKGRDKTLLLVLRKDCRYCTASAPFYERLISEVDARRVRAIAVLPGDILESREYLQKLKVPIIDVKKAPLESVGVEGTPTLILVNDKGVVVRSWVGQLPPDKEADVLRSLSL